MTLRLLTLLMLFTILINQVVLANDKPKTINKVHVVCKNSPSECLPEVNLQLLKTVEHSRVWYNLMQYKMESLFLLQDTEQLHAITKKWINEEKLPIPFKVSIYIYYAKTIFFAKGYDKTFVKSEREKYIRKAEQQLALMNNVYPDPMLLMQLANLKMFVGETLEAYQSLLPILTKYKNHPDPELKLELFGTLGHLADRLGYKKKAIFYWKECLIWAKEFNNKQQTATIYLNLANSQASNDEFSNAEQNYLSAIDYSTIANDIVKRSQAEHSFAKLMYKQGKISKTKEILKNIDTSKLLKPISNELQQIKDSN